MRCISLYMYKLSSELRSELYTITYNLESHLGDLIVIEVRHNGGVLIHCPGTTETTYS